MLLIGLLFCLFMSAFCNIMESKWYYENIFLFRVISIVWLKFWTYNILLFELLILPLTIQFRVSLVLLTRNTLTKEFYYRKRLSRENLMKNTNIHWVLCRRKQVIFFKWYFIGYFECFYQRIHGPKSFLPFIVI